MAGRRKSPIDTEPTAHDAPAPFAKKSSLSDIRVSLLDWFRQDIATCRGAKRARSPAIWISEIALQQTRTETVKGYFARFIARFPTVSSPPQRRSMMSCRCGRTWLLLAGAEPAPKRRQIRDLHHGEFPTEPAAIAALPGIGPLHRRGDSIDCARAGGTDSRRQCHPGAKPLVFAFAATGNGGGQAAVLVTC